MKIFVKTLKDTHFDIEVKPEDTVADVKKNIETVQGGPNKCPAAKQLLIHQGNVLEDDTTLQDNKVAENSFIVIMLTKTKGSPGEGSSVSAAPTTKVPISTPLAAPSPVAAPLSPAATPAPVPAPAPAPAPTISSAPAPAPSDALPPAPAPADSVSPTESETSAYGQGASNLVSVTNFNQIVEQILDMGGGTWDRDTVFRALRAAHNNPERAVEYMYIGIPEQDDVPPVARAPGSGQPANPPSSGPNADLLHLFPQGFPSEGSNTGGAGVLDFLRHSPQFQALRAIVQANPQMLQPMLQELGKQNPQVVRLIQEHQADFRRLINEPIEGGEGNILGQLATAVPQAIQVTPAEREAIERLEAMGFDRATVLEVYFACNKNEELAANYLLDHLHEFED